MRCEEEVFAMSLSLRGSQFKKNIQKVHALRTSTNTNVVGVNVHSASSK